MAGDILGFVSRAVAMSIVRHFLAMIVAGALGAGVFGWFVGDLAWSLFIYLIFVPWSVPALLVYAGWWQFARGHRLFMRVLRLSPTPIIALAPAIAMSSGAALLSAPAATLLLIVVPASAALISLTPLVDRRTGSTPTSPSQALAAAATIFAFSSLAVLIALRGFMT